MACTLALLVVVLFGVLPVHAQETINAFVTNVTLRADAAVEVTETITVNAEGREIRRGIYRDIPTMLANDDGSRLRSGLDVLDVRRNGQPERYSVETIGGGFKRIRIGDPDVFLQHGRHSYTIRYTMTRMGRRFAEHDELFWNATGNYWNFPILTAVTNVTLPEGAVISDLVGYTGTPGSTEQAVTIERTADNRATIRTTRPLASGEGVSVAAAFQKGVLAEPTEYQRLAWWFSDYRDVVLPMIAVGIVLLYNLLAWSAVGRDPAKGTIIPLFHPPRGFSPALTHYVHRMGWRRSGWTAFTAAIFSLGVKGLLNIDNTKKVLKVTVTGKQPDETLPPGEKVLFDYFTSKGSVTVNTTNGPKINSTRGEFISRLESENRQVYFRNNTGYVVLGLMLSLALLLALVLLEVMSPLMLILCVVAGVGLGLFAGIGQAFLTGGNVASRLILGVWIVIVAANMGGALVDMFADISIDTPLVAAASIAAINVVFAILMRAPTVQGRKVMDQIDGFRMYLDTAEENRLNIHGEPPMTIERFERILPYAIALGVEKPWSEHFEGELKRNAVADAQAGSTYRPRWYSGSDWSSAKGGFSSGVSAVATGMSAAMIAAQPSSSSGSGFSGGGGGGSGGGGGGGGGGGW